MDSTLPEPKEDLFWSWTFSGEANTTVAMREYKTRGFMMFDISHHVERYWFEMGNIQCFIYVGDQS